MATTVWPVPHSPWRTRSVDFRGRNKVRSSSRVCMCLAHGRTSWRGQLSESWASSPDERSSEAHSSSHMDPAAIFLKQRIVFLGTQVDDIAADLLISQLLLLDAQDPTKDIKMFINSPGGSISAGMGIHDAMKICRADVSTICFGLAASMGAFLLASGTKGKRFCMPNSRVMIHQPLGSAGGAVTDITIQVREMMYHKIKLNRLLARSTGKTEEQIEIDTDRDNFLNAWEAVEYGLVDAVIDDGKPGLVAPIGEVKEPPKPRLDKYWTIPERSFRVPKKKTEKDSEKEPSGDKEKTTV